VLFVCPRGAGMSRIAAAWFNTTAPEGWNGTSAGIEPQSELGTNAPRLLAGTPAEAQLDRQRPRAITPVSTAERTIALCCSVPGAERWDLEQRAFTEVMRDEIRRVTVLIAELHAELAGVRP
jgi:hypothetical protein